jgi:hypothetical protein
MHRHGRIALFFHIIIKMQLGIIVSFVQPLVNVTGSHMTSDDCGRIWHVMYKFGLYIYDSSGLHVARWNITFDNDTLYDILLLPNYVLLLTANSNNILQYDLQISC